MEKNPPYDVKISVAILSLKHCLDLVFCYLQKVTPGFNRAQCLNRRKSITRQNWDACHSHSKIMALDLLPPKAFSAPRISLVE